MHVFLVNNFGFSDMMVVVPIVVLVGKTKFWLTSFVFVV